MAMKEVRQAILSTLQANLSGVKTFWTGYPVWIETRHTPFVAVYSLNETADWVGQRAYAYRLTLSIVIGINAQPEVESRNRGVADEDWLNDTAEQVVSILFNQLHEIPDHNARLVNIGGINYRQGGGNIRTAEITVAYEVRPVFLT